MKWKTEPQTKYLIVNQTFDVMYLIEVSKNIMLLGKRPRTVAKIYTTHLHLIFLQSDSIYYIFSACSQHPA